MSASEVVLLVEPEGANENGKFRAVELKHCVNAIMVREHLDPRDPSKVWTRTFVCKNDERALTGQRIFREDLPPLPEEKEKPLYDELVLKEPLKFGVDGATFSKLAKKYGKK